VCGGGNKEQILRSHLKTGSDLGRLIGQPDRVFKISYSDAGPKVEKSLMKESIGIT